MVSTELQHSRFAEIAPYHELIDKMLKPNTVTTVHQRLRDERGLWVRITTFRRYGWATMPDHQANRARVTVRRTTHRQARKPRSTTATLRAS